MAKKRRKRMDDPGNWGGAGERDPGGGTPASRDGTPRRGGRPPGPPPDATFEGWVEMPSRDGEIDDPAGRAAGGSRHEQRGWMADVPPGFVVPTDPEPEPDPPQEQRRLVRRRPPAPPERPADPSAAGDDPSAARPPRPETRAAPARDDASPPSPERRRVGASGRLATPRRRPVDETLVAPSPVARGGGAATRGAAATGMPPGGERTWPSDGAGPAPRRRPSSDGLGAGDDRAAARRAGGDDRATGRPADRAVRRDADDDHVGGGGSGPPPRRPYRRHGHFADGQEGRRLEPAGKVLLALVIGLLLAALLNAQSLQTQAEAMEIGPARSLMMGLVKPVVAVSSFLHLDAPRSAIETAMGRGEQEHADVHTRDVKQPDVPKAEIFEPTPDRKLAIWVGGDSMAMVFGQSLVAMADQTGVIDTALDYHISSGLSRPDFFDWPKRLKKEMESFQPDVPVALFGANDAQDVDYEGKVLYFGSDEWLALYHERVGEAMDILSGEQKRPVWWVGMPITRLADYNKNIRILNSVYKEEAAKRDNVTYVDTYGMFGDADGAYTDYLPALGGKTERVRQEDGIHWSRAGGDLVAAEVLEQISRLYKFPFSP